MDVYKGVWLLPAVMSKLSQAIQHWQISKMIHTIRVLPVGSAEAERGFSIMNRIMNARRSRFNSRLHVGNNANKWDGNGCGSKACQRPFTKWWSNVAVKPKHTKLFVDEDRFVKNAFFAATVYLPQFCPKTQFHPLQFLETTMAGVRTRRAYTRKHIANT